MITSNQSQAVTKAENPTTDSQTTGSTTEMLSGTWDGEDVIDKIVIMRGGRGFVVFKNGASMNVIIKFDDFDSSKILVIQSAKSNASFFPDLPRQVALREAVNASPIQWTFSLKDNNTLSGTKKTLLSDGEENAKEGTVVLNFLNSSERKIKRLLLLLFLPAMQMKILFRDLALEQTTLLQNHFLHEF